MIQEILFNQENQLGIITLNRESALNALSFSMINSLYEQLKLWQQDDSICAVIIKAAPNSKAFCAGGDIRWLYETGINNNPEQKMFFAHEYRLNQLIYDFNKPYIALMDGITMGGGVGISLHGSHPIATERFIFAMPETGIGFFPDIGASFLLSRLRGEMGIYLGLTGNKLNQEEAVNLGLVKHALASSCIDDFIAMLQNNDLSVNTQNIIEECLNILTKQYLTKKQDENNLNDDLSILKQENFINNAFRFKTINEIFNYLTNEQSEINNKLLQNIAKKSPLSLAVTLELLRRAKNYSLQECLEMDFCLVNHFIKDHDFYEGVRALIIDKDKSPRWKPKSIQEVSASQIENYFQ